MRPFNFYIPSFQQFYNSPIRNQLNALGRDNQINNGIRRSVFGYAGFENSQALTNNIPSPMLGLRASIRTSARVGIGQSDRVIKLSG